MSDAFPSLVYKSPGPHWGPPGKTYAYLGVKDEKALQAALGAGWHRTLPEACADAPEPLQALALPAPSIEEPPLDNGPPTRAELTQKAAQLGVKIDGRWSDSKLSALVTEAVSKR